MTGTTVTVTASGTGSANGIILDPRVLTGALPVPLQPGALVTNDSNTTPQAAITPQKSGSWIYAAIAQGAVNAVFTANPQTTLRINDLISGVIALGSGRGTAYTSSGVPVTVGASGPTVPSGFAEMTLAEILAAATLVEDSSTPASVTNNSGKTVSTGVFTPPAGPGSLIVVIVSVNSTFVGAPNLPILTVTDTYGLVWLELGSDPLYGITAIFAAEVPTYLTTNPLGVFVTPDGQYQVNGDGFLDTDPNFNSQTTYANTKDDWGAQVNIGSGSTQVLTYPDIEQDYPQIRFNQIAAIDITYGFVVPANIVGDLMIDCWLGGSGPGLNFECSIFLKNVGVSFAGDTLLASGLVFGWTTWDLYHRPASSPPQYIFNPAVSQVAGTINVLPFFNYLVAAGYLANPWVQTIETGLEVITTFGKNAVLMCYQYSIAMIMKGEPGMITNYDPTGVNRNLPTVAAGAGLGTSPPTPTMDSRSNDQRGIINFGSGSTPAAGTILTVTFAEPRDTNRLPFVSLTETIQAMAGIDIAVGTVSATGFTIVQATRLVTASQAAGTYSVGYLVVD